MTVYWFAFLGAFAGVCTHAALRQLAKQVEQSIHLRRMAAHRQSRPRPCGRWHPDGGWCVLDAGHNLPCMSNRQWAEQLGYVRPEF